MSVETDHECSPCRQGAHYQCQQGCPDCPQHVAVRSLPDPRFSWYPPEYFDRPREGDAARSLSRFLGVPETRALALLDHPDTLVAELRSRQQEPPRTGMAARRELERKYRPAHD